jgi:excinuclease ABC subunit C
MSEFDSARFLKTISSLPGVYQMLGRDDEILYVGKAKNLKKRLSSYFRSNVSVKTAALVKNICDIQVIIARTETEALIIEGNLIKKHQPKYNILFRDDKSYPYIRATNKHDYPRLEFYRGSRSLPGKYFGPFPSVHSLRETLNLLQKVFLLRSCNETFFKNRSRPCLQYQIKRCSAPCVGLIAKAAYQEDFQNAIAFLDGRSDEILNKLQVKMTNAAEQQEYELAAKLRDQLIHLRHIQQKQYAVSGKRNIDIIAFAQQADVCCVYLLIVRDGRVLGSKSFFPKLKLSDDLSDILASFFSQYYLGSNSPLPDVIVCAEVVSNQQEIATLLSEQKGRKVKIQNDIRGDKAKWLNLANKSAEQAVTSRLTNRKNYDDKFKLLDETLSLPSEINRIECFDISHHRGEATVASCVVFNREGAVNSQYRHFNISNKVKAGDDYAAMKEALTRRYSRLKKETGVLPELLIIDGGKGQLTQAREVLQKLELDNEITLLGIAKGRTRKPGFETLFLGDENKVVELPSDSPALHLLQQVRDEAHRFAIAHNRSKVKNKRSSSSLESIEGVGPKKRRALLNHFGGMQEVVKAGVDDLTKVPGVNTELAKKIYDALH